MSMKIIIIIPISIGLFQEYWALPDVAQWTEYQPANQRAAGLIPSQGTCLDCGPGPQQGVRERQPHVDVYLLVLLPPFLSLKINKIFFFFKNFYCYSITVVCIFSPSLHPTPSKPTSLPCLHPLPWFCPCVLYSGSCKPLSLLSSPHSPLAIVRLFLTSMSLVIYYLLFSFVDYIPVKGELI